jgi:hypothetical protein
MKSIFIFVPAFGQQISAATFMTTHSLQNALGGRGITASVSTLSFPDIAELRSMAFSIWHDTMKHDYLLFIDADMAFQPEMVLDMMLLDEPLVGTIYRQRKETVGWAGSGTGTAITQRRGKFMEVEGVGMGCTLIRRDLANLMYEKYPQMIDERLSLHPAGEMIKHQGCNRLFRIFEKMDMPDRGVISEDLSFCIRWRQLGGTVWGAIGYDVSHIGPYDYRGNYLSYVNEIMAQQEQQKALAQLAQQAHGAQKGNGLDPSPMTPELTTLEPPRLALPVTTLGA